MSDLPHVVILGAGFGGLGAVKRLRDAPVRVTLIDKHDYHTFQPLLYQVATAELAPSEVGFPIRNILHGHSNLTFYQSTVDRIDLGQKVVVANGLAPLPYDYLILALGAVVNFFNTPGAEEFALPLYTMNDAIRLKERILNTFEAVNKDPTLVDDGGLTFSIVGGGATGVELAGALAELLHEELANDYPHLPVDKARVVLYEHSPQLLGAFHPKLQAYARQALEARGVDVQTGVGVRKVDAKSIELSTGETIKTHTLVWAAGLQANPIVASLDVELAHGSRIPVGPDLQVKGHPGAFAIGDIAIMTDGKTGKALPGLGATALQAGHFVGDAIKELLVGKQPTPFTYVDKGTMAQVGRGAAVVELPFGGTMTGLPAWLAWFGVHLTLLSGGEAKANTIIDWGWTMLTRKRGKCIVLSDEDHNTADTPRAARG